VFPGFTRTDLESMTADDLRFWSARANDVRKMREANG
jgi:hypothetical protein